MILRFTCGDVCNVSSYLMIAQSFLFPWFTKGHGCRESFPRAAVVSLSALHGSVASILCLMHDSHNVLRKFSCAAKFLFHSCLDNVGTFICLLTPSWINLRYCGSVSLPHPPTACQLPAFTLFGNIFAASKMLWKTANSIFIGNQCSPIVINVAFWHYKFIYFCKTSSCL